MTKINKEREEFEQIMVSFTSPDGDYFSANIGSADNIDELWSWHQQSLERAVEKERERTVNKAFSCIWNGWNLDLGNLDRAKKHFLDSLTTPQLDVNDKK